MGRSVPHNLKSTHQTEFVKIFNSLCGRYGRWEIWQDFVTLAAIAISNTVDRSQAAEREKTYIELCSMPRRSSGIYQAPRRWISFQVQARGLPQGTC